MKRFIPLILFILIFNLPAFAAKNCDYSCGYEGFFKENYENLLQYLAPEEDCRRLFDIIFNAYTIKFKTFDEEYKNLCTKLYEDDDCSNPCAPTKHEIKDELKNLTEMAIEEYDSFLEDLNFELCGCEEVEHKIIKKAKGKFRRPLKKLITKNCKNCASLE